MLLLQFRYLLNKITESNDLNDTSLDTVIIDLDHTLIETVRINSKNILTGARRCYIRPGAREFIKKLKALNLNVYIYTASRDGYCKRILRNLDPENVIDKVYTRRHCQLHYENVLGSYRRKNVRKHCKIENYVIVDDKKNYTGEENDFVFKIRRFNYKKYDSELETVYNEIVQITLGNKTKYEAILNYNVAV